MGIFQVNNEKGPHYIFELGEYIIPSIHTTTGLGQNGRHFVGDILIRIFSNEHGCIFIRISL